jgi:BirA family biotin operon repressor/biotin-[acetyl-CoA-carboxylase] ligase
MFTIRADYQTAGRGQAGNSWESERGKNLLFSTLLRYPEVEASEQWRLSMLVAVAVREAIGEALKLSGDEEIGQELAIKWPNDIYYKDKKVVGILIENILSGRNIAYTIAGIGINVNQTEWLSNAPNPLSIKQITQKEYNIEEILQHFLTAIQKWETEPTDTIRTEYINHLYRRTGWHSYVEREVSTAPTSIIQGGNNIEGAFDAEWVDITQQGEWVVRLKNGQEKKFHFKQVRFVL